MGASGSVIACPGEVFVSPELRRMSNNNVSLKTLAIMQRPLGSVGAFQRSGKLLIPGLGQHEYVIIELTSEKFVMAEKFGRAKERPAGIHIALASDCASIGHCRKKVNLMGVDMPLAELLQILGSDRPDYNLFTSNCWKYAFRIAQNLLRRCIADVGMDSIARECLQNELAGLLEYKRNAPARYRPLGLASHHPEHLKKYNSLLPLANHQQGS